MKKLTLVAFYKDKERITSLLQELGLVHLEMQEVEWDESLEDQKEKKTQWEEAIALIEKYKDEAFNRQNSTATPEDIKEALLSYKKELERLHQEKHDLEKKEATLEPWGEYNSERVKSLEDQNILIRFYVASKREFQKYDFGPSIAQVVNRSDGMVYFVVARYKEEPTLPFEQITLPNKSLSALRKEIKALDEEEMKVINKIRSYQQSLPLLNKELSKIHDEIASIEANNSYSEKAGGQITVITGWFPQTYESKISEWLNSEQLSYTIDEPTKEDNVPVILKNKKYPRLFENITKIFQLPNYYELDLTPLIAVFYPIFFAYCLGDAGYGFILVTVAVVGWFTFFKNMRNVAALGMVLGVMTMIVGIVKSGTLFGIPILNNTELPVFKTLSKFVLITDEQDFVFNAFNVALMVGVVQILVGVITSIIKNVKYRGWKYGISGLGKFLIIISVLVLFLAKMQQVELFLPYSPYAPILLFAGIALVLLFHDPEQSILKRIGSGVLPLYFIFTNLLGDTLSYIRLFALGVASSILGLVVNQIGMQIMEGAGIVGISIAIIFLIFGHSLNLALATLGAFVHPLRLTFVEFYNNAGFEGGGVIYRPFKKEAA